MWCGSAKRIESPMVKFNLDIPRMGYFILFKSSGKFISRQIKAEQLRAGFTEEQSDFIHIAVSGGGPYIVEVSWPRIHIGDIRTKFRGSYIKIVRYSNEEYEDQKRYRVAFWAASTSNLGYDIWGVLYFKVKWLFRHSKRLFFCSENALWALSKEYPRAINLPPEKCMPAHFLRAPGFSVVWEGIIE